MGARAWRVFLLLHFLEAAAALPESPGFEERLFELVNAISAEYFQAFKCVTFATDAARNVAYLEKRVPLFLVNLSRGRRRRQGKLLAETFEQGCGGYVVQTRPERRLSVVRMLLDAKNETISNRYNTQRYLFLPVAENDTDLGVLLEPKLLFLPNFLLVSPRASGAFSLATHSVFDPENARGYEVIDTWSPSRGYARRRDLYPDKIKNVRGRKLLFGVMDYVPYTVVLRDGNRTIFDGLEKRIAVQFVETINGTYEAFDHPVHLWGTKFPNGSGNGIFGSVQRGEADIGYAAFYQWYCDVIDCTFPYVQAEVSCLVPKPRVLTSWQTILLPFALSTWIGLFLAYAVSSLVVLGLSLTLRRLRGERTPGRWHSAALRAAFELFRLQMQQTPKSSHESGPLATFVKVSYLYYFLVALFWQGGIASILTIPRYEKPIDTAADLVSRYPHVQWGGNHDTWIHSIENATEPDIHEIVKKFVVLPQEKLVQRAKARNFGFFVEKLHGNGHFGFRGHINRETVPYLRMMKNYVYTAYTVLVLPRGSPYLEKLDHLVHWMIDTGIILKMETQVSLEVIDNHLQNMIRFSETKDSEKVTLTLGHIKGPIYIYVVGVLVSAATLVGENWLFRHGAKVLRKGKKRARAPMASIAGGSAGTNFRGTSHPSNAPREAGPESRRPLRGDLPLFLSTRCARRRGHVAEKDESGQRNEPTGRPT